MDAIAFVQELETFKAERLSPIVGAGRTSLAEGAPGDARKMLQVALANEISVSELAAAWMPSTTEIDVKLAFARQAGDEAGHFQLVADRLSALGFDIAAFQSPGENPLFQYMKGLSTTRRGTRWLRFSRSPPPRAPRPLSGWAPPASLGAEHGSEALSPPMSEAQTCRRPERVGKGMGTRVRPARAARAAARIRSMRF